MTLAPAARASIRAASTHRRGRSRAHQWIGYRASAGASRPRPRALCLYAALMPRAGAFMRRRATAGLRPPILFSSGVHPMSDVFAVTLFLVCLGSTLALAWGCEWLRPRDTRPAATRQPGRTTSEVRQ
jgi:hypothetical protein